MKKITRIMAFSITLCVTIWLSVGYNQTKALAVKKEADGGKDTYIVQMEDSNAMMGICVKYGKQVSGDSESYENLEDENCIVLNLTESQAESLSNAGGINFLESDLEMQGTADDMKPVSECDTEWNFKMVNADVDLEEDIAADNNNPIKVAVIDSGIDYTNGINVVKRKNFIPSEDNISILYEDSSGHGTSVAGVIAASGEENKDMAGIARNAEIYSAKVLDSNNKAPVSRVAEGIYWAIEQGVDIINLSLGTSKPSELLEKAVKDAYDKGILLIASAGNNEKAGVEYPAAYDEVMAVASVDSRGEHSSQSAVGDKVEIAAPGEKIKTASCFDGEIVVSGTSISTPHITAIAARLWEKDRTKSAQFIRGLIDSSAKAVGKKSEYGYGIADLSYAVEIYDEYEKNYVEGTEESVDETLENIEEAVKLTDNDAGIEVYENDYVEGRWLKNNHLEFAEQVSIKEDDLKVLKWGAIVSDYRNGLKGTKVNPFYHGYGYGENVFYDNMKKTNYIASYIFLTKMAVTFEKSSSYKDPTIVQGLSQEDYKVMCDGVDKNYMYGHDAYGNLIQYTWENMLTRNDGTTKIKYEISNHNKALLLYGMALHTATDTFSHSSHINGKLIRHTHNYDEIIGDADNETVVPNRYTCAKVLARRLLSHVKSKETGKTADWVITSYTYKGVFKLVGFSSFAKSVNATTYKDNKAEFDDMNLDFVDVRN